MASSVNVNGKTVAHKGSAGVSTAFPDVCLTPIGSAVVPIPYPNVARAADLVRGSTTVKADGQPIAIKGCAFGTSTGDEPGLKKGIISQEIKGESRFKNYSFDVKIEGKNACRLMDPMMNNGGSPENTPPTPEVQPPLAPDAQRVVVETAAHVLRVEFAYAHPNPWTDRAEAPRFGVGYDMKGPENETWSPLFEYTYGVSHVMSPGDYDLSFREFDRERRELLPASRLAQLGQRARPVLQRAQGMIENTKEDIVEVRDRLQSDAEAIIDNTTGSVRARFEALQAQIDASMREIEAAQRDLQEAIRNADDSGWGTIARRAVAAARRGSNAIGDAVDRIDDTLDGLEGDARAAWDDAAAALTNARTGLSSAADDIEEAILSYDN